MPACAMGDARDGVGTSYAGAEGGVGVKSRDGERAGGRVEGEIRWKTPELVAEDAREGRRDVEGLETCSTSDDSRPCSRADAVKREISGGGGKNSPEFERAWTAARKRFSEEAVRGDGARMRRELNAMGQRELQALFVEMFEKVTTSNNNQWLRRRISAGLGLDDHAEQTSATSEHTKPVVD